MEDGWILQRIIRYGTVHDSTVGRSMKLATHFRGNMMGASFGNSCLVPLEISLFFG